jgi:hypothetical protein
MGARIYAESVPFATIASTLGRRGRHDRNGDKPVGN